VGGVVDPSERRTSGAGDVASIGNWDAPSDVEGPVYRIGTMRPLLVLAVLTLVNIVNVMDRSLMSVLAEPIRREFHLSDTQLGILTGLAFAVVYGFLAIPVSRIADRGLYRGVIAICLVVWSSLTVLGGLAHTFFQLAATRVGVAAGEGGLNPASHALISRLFSPQRRGTAIGIFSLGVPLGVAGGALLAGFVAQSYGWRAALFAIGPVGFFLLPLLFVLPAFPIRQQVRGSIAWGAALGLLTLRTYRNVWLACALSSMFSFGAGAFAGPAFMRAHHMSLSEIGVIFGATAVLGTGAGAFLGGFLFDAVKRRFPGYELYPSVLSLVISAAAALGGWLFSDNVHAISALTVALFCYALTAVPAMTVAQNMTSPDKRAGASALLGVSTGVVGATMGPLIVGTLSDTLAFWAGPRNVKRSHSLKPNADRLADTLKCP